MLRTTACFLVLVACVSISVPAQTVVVDDFHDASSAGKYTLTNPYGSGGTFAVDATRGKLVMTTGTENTCTVARNDGLHFLNAGERWGVDVENAGNCFLFASTAPGQPDGADSFGVRLRRDVTWQIQTCGEGGGIVNTGIPTVVMSGPRGGTGGIPWDDFVATGGGTGRITRIDVRSGDVIDAITVCYSRGCQARHGGTGGNADSLTLQAGEFITHIDLRQVEYKNHNVICYIRFDTNLNRRKAFGNESSGTSLGTLYAPSGVVAFCGRSGDYLDQLGAYEMRPGTVWVDRTDPTTFEFYFEEKLRGNRAASGTARQSSDYSALYPASNAIDGNFSTSSHTSAADAAPRWDVELEAPVTISSIILYNRKDCCASRLRDITVSILDESGTVLFESDLLNPENVLGGGKLGAGATQLEVAVSDLAGSPVTGRVVRVQRTPDPDLSGTDGEGSQDDKYVLSFSEVAVFGYKEHHRTFLGSATHPGLESRADLYVGFEGFGWGDTFLFDNLREEVIPVIPQPVRFQRGDSNASSTLDIADAIFSLGYLFAHGTPPSCLDSADVNDSGEVDIADVIALLSHLFAQSGDLPQPFGKCDVDPTADELGCGQYEAACPEPPPPTCEEPVSLRVLAYNTHLFEDSEVECICRCGETWKDACQWDLYQYDDGTRRQEIANRVRASGADVVLLQEVWANAWQAWFANALKPQYPNVYYVRTSCDAAGVYDAATDTCLWSCAAIEQRVPGTDPSFTLSNGLVLLSKWELVDPDYRVFPTFQATPLPDGNDSWARKCVLTATALVGNDQRPVRVGVSHTLGKTDDEKSEWPGEHLHAAMAAFELDGLPYMFGADPNGAGWICAIENCGFLDRTTEEFRSGAGWREVRAGNLDEVYADVASFELNGRPYLFLVTTGNDADILRIEEDSPLGWTLVTRRPWGSDCLPGTLVSFELDGRPHAFCLSQSRGGVLARIKADASGWEEVRAEPWDAPVTDYKAVTSFELDGVPYLLAVKGGQQGYLFRVEGGLTPGWNLVYSGPLGYQLKDRTITSLVADGRVYVFGLAASGGVFLTIDPQPTSTHAWEASAAANWRYGVPAYNAVESFVMDGEPYLFAVASCCTSPSPPAWTPGKNACGYDRPSEAYFKHVRIRGGRPDVATVYQLEDLKIIRDETIDGTGAPAVMMGDFNVHEEKYGFMNAIFGQAGAVDAYVAVHGSGFGGATSDGFRNKLHRFFWNQGSSARLDDVYFTPAGAGWKLVPRDARVIRDWTYGANQMDLSDHYPIMVDFDLCKDTAQP